MSYMLKTTNIYLKQHAFNTAYNTLHYYCSWAVEILSNWDTENCVRKIFVFMKVVINGQNNLCIAHATRKTLFCYCSLVVEILQHRKLSEIFFVPTKYVINGKSNLFNLFKEHVRLHFVVCYEWLKHFNKSGIWKMVSTVWNQLVVRKTSRFWKANKLSACSYRVKIVFKKGFFP